MTDPAPVTSGIGGFTKEDAIRMSKKVGEAGLGYAKVALEKGKSSFNEAKEAGMFKLESLTAPVGARVPFLTDWREIPTQSVWVR